MAVMFSKLPANYESVFGELVYKISGIDVQSVVDVEIIGSGDTTPLAVKRCIGGESVDINVASHLRRRLSPKPVVAVISGFYAQPGRNVKASIRCAGFTSAERLFTCAAENLYDNESLTLLPVCRSIWWDESDEISVLAPSNALLSYVISLGGGGSYKLESGKISVQNGISAFSLSMRDIADKVHIAGYDKSKFDSMRIEIKNGALGISCVDYEIRRSDERSLRLCWLNSLGGIDYHTFRCAAAEKTSVDKKSVSRGGIMRSYVSEVDTRTVVTTGYMPCSWIEGLAGITHSPLVWKVDGTEFRQVEVLGGNVETTAGKLNLLTFEIRESAKKKIQKF